MQTSGPDATATNSWTIDTDRLRIQVPDHNDAADLFGLVGGESRRTICQNLLWDGPDNQGEVEEWVEKCRTSTFADFGFHWVIRDRWGDLTGVRDRAIGAIGIIGDGTPGRGDVGYWLGVPYWGNGVVSEALRGVVDLAFATLRLAKLEAEVFTENERGRRLVESMGFVLEGTQRRAVLKYGEWVDAAQYGMLPEEWKPAT